MRRWLLLLAVACASAGVFLIAPGLQQHDGAMARLVRAADLARDEDWAAAEQEFSNAIAFDRDNPVIWVGRAHTRDAQSRRSGAHADITQAFQLDPNATPGLVGAILGPFRRNTYAYNYYTEGTEQSGLATRYDGTEGEQAYIDRALLALDRSIALNPRSGDALAYRGLVYAQMDDHDHALANFNRALAVDHDSVFALVYRGASLVSLGRLEEAFADVDRALELDPSYGVAYLYRGSVNLYLERYDDAYQDFDTYVTLFPSDSLGYDWRGYISAIMYDHVAALADYDRAIELYNGDWNYYLHRGDAHYSLAHYDLALADFRRAADMTTDEALPYASLAVVYCALDDDDATDENVELALDIDPSAFLMLSEDVLRGNCGGPTAPPPLPNEALT